MNYEKRIILNIPSRLHAATRLVLVVVRDRRERNSLQPA
jgi:hypothetical protein